MMSVIMHGGVEVSSSAKRRGRKRVDMGDGEPVSMRMAVE